MFRAYEPEQDRLVAVKLFRLDLPPDRLDRLVAELEQLIAADLTHPAIAAPIAAGVAGVTAYLAQDFVAAESLDTLLRDRASRPVDVVRVITQVAGALDVAAAGRIVHGALHPRDLLVSPDDVRVTGLGIARALERVGVTAPVRRPYTAPERVGGRAWDRRADVFSLGVLAHEMLWGRRPSGTGARAADELTDVPGADLPALRIVFARALAETFTERFDSAERFVDALRGALGEAAEAGSDEPALVDHFAGPAGQGSFLSEEELMFGPLRMQPGDSTSEDENASALPLATGPSVDTPAAALQVEPDGVAGIDAPPAPESRAPRPLKKATRRERPAPPDARGVRAESSLFLDASPEQAAATPIATAVAADQSEPPATADVPFATVDRAGSAVWPLVMALGVGVAVGFAGGYGVGGGQRDRTAAPAAGLSGTAPAESSRPAVASPAPAVPAATSPTAEPRPAPPPPATEPPRAASPPAVRQAPPAAVTAPTQKPARPPTTPERATRPAAAVGAAPAPPAPEVSTAALVVESRPAGANVFVDGRLVGTTPLLLPGVAAGDHALRMELAGYNAWAASVRLAAGERRRVAASLER